MQEFLLKLFNMLLSEAGMLSVLLLSAVLYQTRQLNLEKASNKQLNDDMLHLAVNQVAAMKEMQAILDKLIETFPTK